MTSRIKLCLVVAIGAALLGCPSGAKAPTQTDLRSAVSVSVDAVQALDKACSDVVHALEATDKPKALAVAEECSSIAHDALSGLAAANDALDAYSAAKQDLVICGLGNGARALDAIAAIVANHAGTMPPIVTDARSLLELAGAYGSAMCPIVQTSDAGADAQAGG